MGFVPHVTLALTAALNGFHFVQREPVLWRILFSHTQTVVIVVVSHRIHSLHRVGCRPSVRSRSPRSRCAAIFMTRLIEWAVSMPSSACVCVFPPTPTDRRSTLSRVQSSAGRSCPSSALQILSRCEKRRAVRGDHWYLVAAEDSDQFPHGPVDVRRPGDDNLRCMVGCRLGVGR
jgi:hypothetical protein